jgi:hypothetical protein
MKIATFAAIFFHDRISAERRDRSGEGSGGLNQSAHALGAQDCLNFAPFFKKSNLLKVGAERAAGHLLRPGTVATERSFLTTI